MHNALRRARNQTPRGMGLAHLTVQASHFQYCTLLCVPPVRGDTAAAVPRCLALPTRVHRRSNDYEAKGPIDLPVP